MYKVYCKDNNEYLLNNTKFAECIKTVMIQKRGKEGYFYMFNIKKLVNENKNEDNVKINTNVVNIENKTIDDFISVIKNQYESISCNKLYNLYIEFFKEENSVLKKHIPIQVFGKKISKYFNKKIINKKVYYIINRQI